MTIGQFMLEVEDALAGRPSAFGRKLIERFTISRLSFFYGLWEADGILPWEAYTEMMKA